MYTVNIFTILCNLHKPAEDTDAIQIGFSETTVTVLEQQGPAVVTISLMDGSATVEQDLSVTFTTSDIGTAQGVYPHLQVQSVVYMAMHALE